VRAAALGAKDKSQIEVANVARGCLEGVREVIAEIVNYIAVRRSPGRDTAAPR
jgi:hypothetical protein